MGQETLVLVLPLDERKTLRERLEQEDFRFRSVPYALFSAQGQGVTATLYASGKLVLQGESPALFASRFLGRAADAPVPASELEERDLIGSDECGKGDYLGPLVVAALKLPRGKAAELRRGGVADSKKLSDESVCRMAGALKTHFAHAIELIEPPEYNALHARHGNLNKILAGLHARAIAKLAEPGICVLIDQFADARLMQRELAGLDIDLRQRPRAEEEMAVAAASMLARDAFLGRMRELSEEWAVDLRLGAGAPADAAARSFVDLHGVDKLSRVAKLHFKNTAKLGLDER